MRQGGSAALSGDVNICGLAAQLLASSKGLLDLPCLDHHSRKNSLPKIHAGVVARVIAKVCASEALPKTGKSLLNGNRSRSTKSFTRRRGSSAVHRHRRIFNQTAAADSDKGSNFTFSARYRSNRRPRHSRRNIERRRKSLRDLSGNLRRRERRPSSVSSLVNVRARGDSNTRPTD